MGPGLVLGIALIVLTSAGAWALVRTWRIIAIGSAYKAKVLSSTIFGAGRPVDPQRADEVSADSYRLLRLLRVRVDPEEPSVTASFMGLRPRTAVYRVGLGATLTKPGRSARGSMSVASSLQGDPGRSAVSPWPMAEGFAQAADVVRSAFGEPNRRRLRRTRAIVAIHEGRLIAERYAQDLRKERRSADGP